MAKKETASIIGNLDQQNKRIKVNAFELDTRLSLSISTRRCPLPSATRLSYGHFILVSSQ